MSAALLPVVFRVTLGTIVSMPLSDLNSDLLLMLTRWMRSLARSWDRFSTSDLSRLPFIR